MKAQIVSFHCVLKNQVGEIISTTFNQDVTTENPGASGCLQQLADALKNLKKGERRTIRLSAGEAYGFYDPKLVLDISRKRLKSDSKDLVVGDQVVAESPDGRSRMYRITSLDSKRATLDANHPLAGQDLVFDIETTEARDATPEEIEMPQQFDSNGNWLH